VNTSLSVEEQIYFEKLVNQGEGERAEKERQTILHERNELKTLLQNASFRRVMWKNLSKCGIYTTTMTGNSWSYHNEGKRAVGLEILNDILLADPNAWILMQQENLLEINSMIESKKK
tara:strand:- start:4494 stop:4847 length:354 start_codon:yes stop_codon:yes gene_type:complete